MRWRLLPRVSLSLIVFICLAASLFYLYRDHWREYDLSMTAGDLHGSRAEVARSLLRESIASGITLKLEEAAGSVRALERVDRGELDLALIQGGLPAGPNVRLIATLYTEPLHLLVKEEFLAEGLSGLRGKTINLSRHGSGTYVLASRVLEFAGLRQSEDYKVDTYSYEELLELERQELPDAIFMVQSLPSDIAAELVTRSGYRLLEIPFGESLHFYDLKILDTEIPRMMYSVHPPVPEENIRTVGNNLLLVANSDVPEEAVIRLIDVVMDSDLTRFVSASSVYTKTFSVAPEYPLHSGAEAYRRRMEPFLKADLIESMENARSFLVSMALALFLVWQWYRKRRSQSFDRYLDEVTHIEVRAMEMEKATEMELGNLMELRKSLTQLKAEALERYMQGSIVGDELMNGFLNHVADVRNYLNSLILHQREVIEKRARLQARQSQESVLLEAEWKEALGKDGRELATQDPPI